MRHYIIFILTHQQQGPRPLHKPPRGAENGQEHSNCDMCLVCPRCGVHVKFRGSTSERIINGPPSDSM